MSRFASIAITCALTFAGCARPKDRTDDKPDARDMAGVARTAMHADYPRALAGVAREVAAKADEFKSHGEVYDFAQKRSKDERDKAFRPVSDALDAALRPDEKQYDAAKVREAFSQIAEGYEP